MKYILFTILLMTTSYSYSQEVVLRIKNDSRYFFNEVALKNDSSRVYFQNIRPNELSELGKLSNLWDTNWITVQSVRKKFLQTQLVTLHVIPIDHQGENLYRKGNFILNINIPDGKKACFSLINNSISLVQS